MTGLDFGNLDHSSDEPVERTSSSYHCLSAETSRPAILDRRETLNLSLDLME